MTADQIKESIRKYTENLTSEQKDQIYKDFLNSEIADLNNRLHTSNETLSNGVLRSTYVNLDEVPNKFILGNIKPLTAEKIRELANDGLDLIYDLKPLENESLFFKSKDFTILDFNNQLVELDNLMCSFIEQTDDNKNYLDKMKLDIKPGWLSTKLVHDVLISLYLNRCSEKELYFGNKLPGTLNEDLDNYYKSSYKKSWVSIFINFMYQQEFNQKCDITIYTASGKKTFSNEGVKRYGFIDKDIKDNYFHELKHQLSSDLRLEKIFLILEELCDKFTNIISGHYDKLIYIERSRGFIELYLGENISSYRYNEALDFYNYSKELERQEKEKTGDNYEIGDNYE